MPGTVSNTYAQVALAQSCVNYVQHIEWLSRASVMLRATWNEGTAQLLSWTELKSHLFELYFTGWTIKPMKEGRKPEYPEKTPGDEAAIVAITASLWGMLLALCAIDSLLVLFTYFLLATITLISVWVCKLCKICVWEAVWNHTNTLWLPPVQQKMGK